MRNLSLRVISLFCALLCGSSIAFSQAAIDRVPEGYGLNWGLGVFSEGTYIVSPSEQESWEKLYPFVVAQVSNELIVSLSRYSVEATQKFNFVPGKPGRLGVLGFGPDFVIFEATLADLPAAPAVVRQLKVFILSPNQDHQFLPNRIAYTIRGERME